MKPRALLALFLVGVLLAAACSRKPEQAAPAAQEVLVTTVKPQDVPRVLERVATLDGFINANIIAQVQGYIVSRDYQEGSAVKQGDLLFRVDPRPFEAALAQAKGTLAKDKANQVKADADEKRAMDLFKRKVISDQERDTAVAAAGSNRANVEADEAAVALAVQFGPVVEAAALPDAEFEVIDRLFADVSGDRVVHALAHVEDLRAGMRPVGNS